MMNNKQKKPVTTLVFIALAILLLFSIFISLRVGRFGMTGKEIFETIKRFFKEGRKTGDRQVAVLFSIRLPRIIMSILVGSALAMSGVSYQGLFKNPMVSPDILGVSSGASIGACIAILFDMSGVKVQMLSFAFGLIAVFFVIGISYAVAKDQGGSLLIMVLAGTVVSSLCNGVTSLIKYVADTDTKLPEITYWLMGSFAKTGGWKNVKNMALCFVIGATILLMLRWNINVLSFGEEDAKTLGINTTRTKVLVILSSTLLTASSVAMSGSIGWVGLVIPHICRSLVGPNYMTLLPCSMLAGSSFMLIVDTVARTLSSGEIPIGVITSIIGAPLFIYLLFKGKKGWS